MRISVQREACRKMPQHTRHGLDVHTVLQGQRCEGVAQVMKSDTGQPRPFQHPLEHVQHAVRGHGASVGDGNTHSLFPILHFCIFSTLIASADRGSVR